MEIKKWKIIAVAVIFVLVVVLIILRIHLGFSKTFILILGADTTGILSIITWIFFQYRADHRRKLLELQMVSEGRELRIEYSFLRKVAGVPTKFRYKEIEAATDNFRALLGRGSSASVFKGILDDGTSVAVKRIEGVEHGEREFRAEVSAIASVQHVNLVRLLGYSSAPAGCRLLVYEFVHNGSLDTWIFPPRRSQNSRQERRPWFSCLPWDHRYRIAIDVAKALAYLHHDCRSRILHLDVKPENILIDENFRAVVSDFGLSKLMSKDESRVFTTIRGTKGYLAPEWLLEHGISEKSDIYSYGMVLLEIVGGRRNTCLIREAENSERKWSYFPRIVTEKLRQGKLMEVVDERMVKFGEVDERKVRDLVHVALWCIQENPRLRPRMTHVIDMLEGRVVIDKPPETEMIIMDLLSINPEPMDGANRAEVVPPVESQHPLTSTYSFAMSALSGR